MEYVLVTLSAIGVTTLLVYKLANSLFKLNMRLKPLLLCAACALLISLVLPRFVVGVAGLTGTMAVLVAFAIVFAYLVAYYDEDQVATLNDEFPPVAVVPMPIADVYLRMEESQMVVDPTSAVSTLGAGEASAGLDHGISRDSRCEQESEAAAAELDGVVVVEDPSVTLVESPEEVMLADVDASCVQEQVALALAAESTIMAAEIVSERMSKEKEDEAEAESATAAAVGEDLVAATENFPEVLENDSPLGVLVNENSEPEIIIEDEISPSVELIPEECVVVEAVVVNHLSEDDDNYQIPVADPASTTCEEGEMELPDNVDELIDTAFLCKDGHDYNGALAAFRKVLSLSPGSESAPFVIVQIGDILKNKGAYDEAIKVFADYRGLPAIKKDESLEQEFINTIAYLRVIKNVLVEHHMANLAFDRIPEEVFRKINAEYREWRNMGSE